MDTHDQPSGFTLPEGYELGDPGPPPGVAPRDVVPGYDLYGGATVTEATDAAGVTYMACCAKLNGSPLYFRVFKLAGSTASEIPLSPLCEGRGSVSVNLYTGQVRWIAWQGSTFWRGVVPGSVAFPPLTSSGGSPPAPAGAWPPPAGVGILYPEERLEILPDVPPCCAIDSRGWVYYLHKASLRDMPGSAAMRVISYGPGSVHGVEVALKFNPNASGCLIQFAGGLYLIGHHVTTGGTEIVSVPVPGGTAPYAILGS